VQKRGWGARRPHLGLASPVRASSTSVEGGAGAGEGEEGEEDVGAPAMGPRDLQSFFEMNAGDWQGHFLVSRGEGGVENQQRG